MDGRSLQAFVLMQRSQFAVEQLMTFSVAQIAFTVFLLSGPKVFDLGAISESVSFWT